MNIEHQADRIAALAREAASLLNRCEPDTVRAQVWWPVEPGTEDTEEAVELARQKLRGLPIDLHAYPRPHAGALPHAERWETPVPDGAHPRWQPGPYGPPT